MKDKTFVALLRGVMPTGKNKVPMAALRVALAKAGLENAQTYIQSGNVIVSSSLSQGELESLIHGVIAANFGGDIRVVARTPRQLGNIMKKTPFANVDNSKVYFSLLASKPAADRRKEFLAIDFSPDKVQIVGDVIYTLYATKHSDSKFNNNFYERKLKVAATTRNYNTMIKLIKLGSA